MSPVIGEDVFRLWAEHFAEVHRHAGDGTHRLEDRIAVNRLAVRPYTDGDALCPDRLQEPITRYVIELGLIV